MIAEVKERTLKNGMTCILKSPEACDAEEMLLHIKRTAGETYFLSRYEEEVNTTAERERQIIMDMREDAGGLLLSAFINDRPVAVIGLNGISIHRKMCHRATFGLSVEQAYWGMGLGSVLIEEIILTARRMGYEQLELGVFSDNDRAIALYHRMGFEEWGRKKRAYRLKDGSYRDEIIMGKFLHS